MIARKLIFPIAEIVSGTRLLKYLRFLQKSQWYSKEQLRQLQEEKLQVLLKHSYENVPFYKETLDRLDLKPDEMRRIEDLSKLPILEKEDVRKNFNNTKLITQNIPKKRLIYASTSGSTGEPLEFCRDKMSDSWNWACKFRGFEWAGYRLGERNVRFWGNPNIIKKSNALSEKVKYCLFNMLFIPAFKMDKENIDKFIANINRFKPVMVRAYASSIYALADYLREKNLDVYSPGCIVVSGDTCFSWQKKVIEQQFGCAVYDDYGSIEINSIAHECQQHIGMHVSMENVIVEFVDEHDEVITDGRIGDIVVTPLSNFSMPLIRYRLGDKGKYLNTRCACGRQLDLIDHIEGRIPDIIYTPDGKHLSLHFFTILFEQVKSVRQFQIRQKSKSQLETLILAAGGFNAKDLTAVNEKIQEYIGPDMVNCVKIVNDIPLHPSGKRKFFISEVEAG